ncbi:PREDICTED: olfactory receptor 146-like [Nanorana parkeri]|uniref:olfactory receptor 146-like n=1 Tax=Nanorana parkeri TaxID=125878 RepID=UPI0008550972|nr:PREDICTED: olfactory receptor 146-like [Nanorana parkeri]
MCPTNYTTPTYFIIKGITDVPELQLTIFLLVLTMYLTTLGGNLTILLLICLESHLHTPMYFFLGNLSILDMSSTTITLHKILVIFVSHNRIVSFIVCMTQMFIFSSFSCDSLFVLTAMSYDRYVAICKPLHYTLVMSRKVCIFLAFICWALGFSQIIPILIYLLRFTLYKSNEINHFFCDIVPLIKLSCNDMSSLELYILINGIFLSIFPFLLTFFSYIFIIQSILKIHSNTGRHKAFYTCSSHLTVVALLYITLGCQYLKPKWQGNLDSNKLFSLFNTATVPMLNPLIYSLKNKDVKLALRKTLKFQRKYF